MPIVKKNGGTEPTVEDRIAALEDTVAALRSEFDTHVGGITRDTPEKPEKED